MTTKRVELDLRRIPFPYMRWLDSILGWIFPLAFWVYFSINTIALFLSESFELAFLARNLDELFLILLLSVAIGAIFVKQTVVVNKKIVLSLAAFLLTGALSTLVNRVHPTIALLGLLQLLKPFVVYFTFQSFLVDYSIAKKMVNRLDATLALLLVLTVFYIIMIEIRVEENPAPLIAEVPPRLGFEPLRSFFGHAGIFGDLMAVCGIYFFSRWLVYRNLYSFGMFLIATLCVVLSLRMRAVLIFPIAIFSVFLFIQFQSFKLQRTILQLTTLFTIGLFWLGGFVLWLLRDELLFRLQNAQSVRRVLLESALYVSLENFGFGAGFGRFGSPASAINYYSSLYYQYGLAYLDRATIEDPSYLTDQWWGWVIGETGLIGFFCFVTIFVIFIAQLFEIGKRWQREQPKLAVFAFATIGILCYTLLYGFAGSFISGPPMSYLVFSLIGFVYLIHNSSLQLTRQAPK